MGTYQLRIAGCLLTPLQVILGEKGNVLHALRSFDEGFVGFGEAYFSSIKKGEIKGWHCHQKATLNIVVPVGEILFRLQDGRLDSQSYGQTDEMRLSTENYQRLTIPPGVWFCFEGLSDGLNLLLNIADAPHDPAEVAHSEAPTPLFNP